MKRHHFAILVVAALAGVGGAFATGALQPSVADGAPGGAGPDGAAVDPTTGTSTASPTPTPTATPTSAPTDSESDRDGDGVPDTYTRVVPDGPPDGDVELDAAPEQVVRGETALPAGTALQVRVASTDGGGTEFLKTRSVSVSDAGTFRARYNFSGIDPGTAFRVTVFRDGTRLDAANGTVTAPASGAQLRHDGDRVVLEPAANQTVTGTATLPEGTNVTVRLHSEGDGGTMFIMQETATVDGTGRFAATFNLSRVASGTTFRTSVHRKGSRLDYAPGVVE
jgi:hypothetical protein